MSDLTDHQQAVFDVLHERLNPEDGTGARYTTLRGYAGTGKTYLVGRLIQQLVQEGKFVRVCAPTHKAAQVLQRLLPTAAVRAQTLHAFLGLRLVPDRKGGYALALERGRKLPSEGIVIVDEASMVGAAEWEYIEKAVDLQWLFVGDPAQLPPVNEDPSPVFEQEGPVLEEVVRQGEGNPILALATRVRNHEPFDGFHFTGDEGVVATRKDQAFLDSALRAFHSDDFQADGTHARVLAYRNATVRRYNRLIRASLYGADAARFVPGEWLVAMDTWFEEGMPQLVNSEEVQVVDTLITQHDDFDVGVWKVWQLEVEGADESFSRYVRVLHEDDVARFEAKLKQLKQAALDEKEDWQTFYQLRERFARVDYAYACTVHKAQGSTFDTAFVDHRDTRACRGAERQALLYVAVTRPARRLALLV